jgi:hypothetical protein
MPLEIVAIYEDGTRGQSGHVPEGQPIVMNPQPDDERQAVFVAFLPLDRPEAFIKYVPIDGAVTKLEAIVGDCEDLESYDEVLQPGEKHVTPLYSDGDVTSAYEIRNLGNRILGMSAYSYN